jgi:DNA-directed RNA polymerase specialized sigma24 family protein
MERLLELASQTPLDAAWPEVGASTLGCRAVRWAQAGDPQALAFLFARYSDDVCRYVHRIVDDKREAEDATQRVFEKLILVIRRYDDRDGVPFLVWLLRVARNAALDQAALRRNALLAGFELSKP